MGMISVSIDICNSTKIKQDIDRLSSKDQNNIIEHYKDLIKQLALCESHFYFYLNEKGIKIEDLFFVKSIGDEIWIVYELKDDKNTLELNSCICSFISALVEIAYKQYHFTIFERTLSQEEQDDFRLQEGLRNELIPVMPKIFVDIIEKCADFNEVRMSVFEKELSRMIFAKKMASRKEMDEYFQVLTEKLNIGKHLGIVDGKHQVSYRTDPIGSEIDLFFRCANKSLPCIVTVGQRLIDNLQLEQPFSIPVDSLGQLAIPEGDPSTKRYFNISCIREELKLKGISDPYNVYRLFAKEALPSSLFIKNGLYEDFSKESRELLEKYK